MMLSNWPLFRDDPVIKIFAILLLVLFFTGNCKEKPISPNPPSSDSTVNENSSGSPSSDPVADTSSPETTPPIDSEVSSEISEEAAKIYAIFIYRRQEASWAALEKEKEARNTYEAASEKEREARNAHWAINCKLDRP